VVLTGHVRTDGDGAVAQHELWAAAATWPRARSHGLERLATVPATVFWKYGLAAGGALLGGGDVLGVPTQPGTVQGDTGAAGRLGLSR
jgi:hypothetical protein